MQECRLSAQLTAAAPYRCVYSAARAGSDGCGLWVQGKIVGAKGITVVAQKPSFLAVALRAPGFALNALVLHAPVDGSEAASAWWGEALAAARSLGVAAPTAVFVVANARIGSETSASIGPLNADAQSSNGWWFHDFLA